MQELTDFDDRETKLRQIADGMVNICEAAFRDVLETLTLEWKGDAPKLFVSRMEELRESVAKDANDILYRLNAVV